jgi:hypothetical protein
MTDIINPADEIKQIEEIINPPENTSHEEIVTVQPEEREDREESQEQDRSMPAQDDLIAQKKKFSKIQRERHRLLAENKRLKEEYETIKSYVNHSNNASMVHYEDSVKLQMDKAKEAKKRAFELNDVDGIVDADAELAQVAAKLENLNSWKAQETARQYQQSQQPQAPQQQYQDYDSYGAEDDNEDVRTWLNQNKWFDENASEYDPDKADAVRAYADSLDFDLRRRGKEEVILTPEYFKKIDQYANYISDQSRSPYRSPSIATVKRGTPVGQSSSKKVKLSLDEQDMARRLGVKEEDYVKFKEQDMRIQQIKGRPY